MSRTVKALVIHPNGVTDYGDIEDSLETLNEIVGGTIGFVSLFEGHLYCNDDGIMLGLEPNPRATDLAVLAGWIPIRGDYLKGSIVFLGHNDEGEEMDVPLNILNLWMST